MIQHPAVFAAVREAIFLADIDTGMLVDANPAAEALSGHPCRSPALLPARPQPFIDESVAQIVLRNGPILGRLLAGIDFQGGAIGRHRLRQVLPNSRAFGTRTDPLSGIPDIDLNRSPQFGFLATLHHRQRSLIGRQRLGERVIAVPRLPRLPVIPNRLLHRRMRRAYEHGDSSTSLWQLWSPVDVCAPGAACTPGKELSQNGAVLNCKELRGFSDRLPKLRQGSH
jgi:hypothetical protein